MSSPGATELLIVLVIVLLILGPKRLPSLGRQLGGGIREFRRSLGSDDVSSRRATQAGRGPDDAAVEPAAPSPARIDDAAPGEDPTGELDSERRSV